MSNNIIKFLYKNIEYLKNLDQMDDTVEKANNRWQLLKNTIRTTREYTASYYKNTPIDILYLRHLGRIIRTLEQLLEEIICGDVKFDFIDLQLLNKLSHDFDIVIQVLIRIAEKNGTLSDLEIATSIAVAEQLEQFFATLNQNAFGIGPTPPV